MSSGACLPACLPSCLLICLLAVPASVRSALPELFPLLTQVIRADYAPGDVHKALASLFAQRVGPLVAAAAAMLPGPAP